MIEQNKARIREFLDRVLSSGEISATGDYFHAEMVEEVPFPGQGPGLTGLKETLTALRAAFPDMRWRVDEQIAEDSRVLTRFVWEGTHRGDFMGMPPTNRGVSVWGMVIDQFEGTKVKSTRILMDTMSLMQQLGASPSAPG
ncbi:MAG: ester cyclase [Betaproteobacteria bacterium]